MSDQSSPLRRPYAGTDGSHMHFDRARKRNVALIRNNNLGLQKSLAVRFPFFERTERG
jgi:hypothetical protein